MSTYDEANIFRKIINGDIPSNKIFENDDVIAILDAFPTVAGHSLLIPKASTCDISEMDEEAAAACFKHLPKLISIVKKATKADGVNVVSNLGSSAGQMVFHTHIHVIPRFDKDELIKFPDGDELSDDKAKAMLEAMGVASNDGADSSSTKSAIPPKNYCTWADDGALGKEAPSIESAIYVKDGPVTLGNGKVTVLGFFAKFAKGDYTTVVGLSKLADQYKDAQFVGISIDPAKEDVESFIKKIGTSMPEIYIDKLEANFPLAHDEGKVIKSAYQKVSGLLTLTASATFIIDGSGKIVWREQFGQGYAPDKGQIGEQLRRVLAGEELISNGNNPDAVEDDEEEEDDIDMTNDDYDSDLGF